jgi:hypothetical protein
MKLIPSEAIISSTLLLFSLLTAKADHYGDFGYTVANDIVTITNYTGTGGAVTIPCTIPVNGVNLPVNIIGYAAFAACLTLTSVTIPDCITNIYQGAFYSCTNLSVVTFGNNVKRLGSSAFQTCTSLTNVTLPSSLTNLEGSMFQYCINLTRVTIPATITVFQNNIFWLDYNLKGVYYEGDASYNVAGPDMFRGVTNATVYYLPGKAGWATNYIGLPTALWLPRVPASDASFGVKSNQFGFNISWASGMDVEVEACTGLANPIWTPLQTNTLPTDTFYFSDPQWTNYPARFYRVRSPVLSP